MLDRVRSEVDRILIVDNSVDPAARDGVRIAALEFDVELVSDGTNIGVGAALNVGMARAAERGFPWVLCLDQDTEPLPGMLETLAHAYVSHPARARVALVGSRSVDEETRTTASGGRPWSERADVMTAGSLVEVEAFRAVGPFREDFFIDYVDFEYCLRLRAAGYRVIVASEPTMVHAAGRPGRHRVLGTSLVASHHDAARRYYITRNRVVVWRDYLRTDPRFVLRDVVRFVKETLKVVLVEADRAHKLRNIARGVGDGLRRRMGPIGPLYPDEG